MANVRYDVANGKTRKSVSAIRNMDAPARAQTPDYQLSQTIHVLWNAWSWPLQLLWQYYEVTRALSVSGACMPPCLVAAQLSMFVLLDAQVCDHDVQPGL